MSTIQIGCHTLAVPAKGLAVRYIYIRLKMSSRQIDVEKKKGCSVAHIPSLNLASSEKSLMFPIPLKLMEEPHWKANALFLQVQTMPPD